MRITKFLVAVFLFLAAGQTRILAQCNSPFDSQYNHNNGQSGIMFNITAVTNVTIDSIWPSLDVNSTSTIAIYYKSGTFLGSQGTSGAWTQVGTQTSVASAGNNVPTPVSLFINLDIAAGQTFAFYVTSTTGTTMNYTNGPAGSTGGQTYSNDGNINMSYANGIAYAFSTTFNPRIFNGRVFYHCCPPPPQVQLVTAPVQLCSDDTFTYSIVPYAYAESYAWSAGNSGTIVGYNNDSTEVQIVFDGTVVNDTICIEMTDTCSSIDTCFAVTINPPTADAGQDASICNTNYQLQGNQGLGSWSVISGSGTFADANLYNTTVSGLAVGPNIFQWAVGNENCPTVYDQVTVTVLPFPVAAFSLNDGCDQHAISFTDNSYALGGVIVSRAWDVDGNGTTDYTAPSFTHTYSVPGVYACTLIVTANQGCRDTIIDIVTVFPNPVVDFSYVPDCEESPMAFSDLTTIASGSLTSWEWHFGDGSAIDTNQNPSHIYPSDAFYTVTLFVTSSLGCITYHSDTVEVFSIPEMDFTAPNSCRNDTVFFTDMSVSTQGVINFWQWDFGDTSPIDNNQNTIHNYATHDLYEVTLLVATNKGCTNSITKPLEVYPVPVPNYTQIGQCEEQTVRFSDDSEMDYMFGSVMVKWDWEFGDGNKATNRTVGNFYQEPGYYNILLTPFSNYGCNTTESFEVLIRPKPQAKILIKDDHVCAQNEIHFQDETYFDYTYDTAGVNYWNWDFGDGNTSENQHPKNTFVLGGSYPTQLIVETKFGCIDSVIRNTEIYYNPKADFKPDTLEGCSPHCVTFIDYSKLKSGELLKYDWWFGDQLLGDEVNPTHCYELEDGTETMEYAVKLKVTTPFGCSDSLVGQDKITIYPNPLADFHLDNNLLSMLEPEVFITNYSEGGDSWLWNFGDSAFSSDRDPISHTYDVSGEYTIELVAISDFGCDNSVSRGVYVKPHQTLYVPSSFTPNSDGKNDLFEIKGEDLELVRLWVYDRWGNEVFFGENEDSSWDGTHSGKKMGMGVYSYVIEYKQSSRIKKRISGNVVISSIDN